MLAPLGISAFVACAVFVPSTSKDEKLQFDWLGFVALSVALASLQIVLNRGQRLDWFESSQIILWTAIGLLSLYFFVAHSFTIRNPFFNWQVFKDRNLSVGIFLTFSFAFISLVPLVLLPTMLEQLRGLEVVTVGLMFIPEGVVELVGLLLVAQVIGRVDSRALIGSGFLLFAAGGWIMTNYNLLIGYWDVVIPLCMQGAAMSIIWLPVFHTLYSTLDTKFHTEAAAMVGLAYSISSSAGGGGLGHLDLTHLADQHRGADLPCGSHQRVVASTGVQRLGSRCAEHLSFHPIRGGAASYYDRLRECLLDVNPSVSGRSADRGYLWE